MADPTTLPNSLQSNQTTTYATDVVNSAVYGSPALNNSPLQPTIPPYLANTNPTTVNPITTKSTATNNINVVLDYDWTYSEDQAIKNTVPFIRLYEKKIIGSAIVNNLIYSLLATPDVLQAGRANTQALLAPTVNTAKSISDSLGITGIVNKISTAGNIKGLISDAADGINSFVTGMISKLKSETSGTYSFRAAGNLAQSKYVDMYNYLYMTQPMSNVYIFPYLDDSYYTVDNKFDVRPYTESSKISNWAKEQIGRTTAFAESVLDLMEPGVYIEKSKFYNFDSTESPVRITFHLLNTKNVDSIIKNYTLINTLITNNKPFRQNRVLVDPPFIYEVEIPGVAYYPYAYISNITVNFVGTRRIVNVGTNNCIVPDAYSVSIILQPLTTQAANYILAETTTSDSQFATRSSGVAIAANILANATNILKADKTTGTGGGPTVITNGNSTAPVNSVQQTGTGNGLVTSGLNSRTIRQ